MRRAALRSIDKSVLFVVKCDVSNVVISATLNQEAIVSRRLHGSKLHYPAVEKEATAFMEAVQKWIHSLQTALHLCSVRGQPHLH